MERRMFVAAGLAVASVAASILLRPDQHIMSAEDFQERERVLSSYPFTLDAVNYLKEVPFFDRHTTTNGGGYTKDYFPYGQWVEVFSDQDEAILHELSHAYYKHLVETEPNFPQEFMEGVYKAIDEDKDYGFFKTLDRGFGEKWKGIDHSDVTEYYASTASKYMGDVASMPEPLKDYYKFEFYDTSKWKTNDQP